MRLAVALVASRLAFTCTVCDTDVALDARVKVAEVVPAGKKTDSGTVTKLELAVRLIRTPLAGAEDCNVTVPVHVFPPTVDVGLIVSPETVAVTYGNIHTPRPCVPARSVFELFM